MNLSDFNIKDLGRNLSQSKVVSDLINTFINELKDYLNKGKTGNEVNMNIENKYSNYWEYQNFMEDNVAANIGLSRWGANITYSNELSKAIDDSIIELTEEEGTLYRKQFLWNGSNDGGFYNVDKFENGQITHITIPKDAIPSEFENKDIIFQYKNDGTIKISNDLKGEVINKASQKAEKLRDKEQERNAKFKEEGHIYEAFEDDGYILLNDLAEDKNFSIEDIDFVVDNYEGDGKYQVINGEYQKID